MNTDENETEGAELDSLEMVLLDQWKERRRIIVNYAIDYTDENGEVERVFTDTVSIDVATSRKKSADAATAASPMIEYSFVMESLQRIADEAAANASLADADDKPLEKYERTEDALIWNKPSIQGITREPLTSFSASIRTQVIKDDGTQENLERHYLIDARVPDANIAAQFSVESSKFEAVSQWAATNLGSAAVVHAGPMYNWHAANAIRLTSGNVPESRVYTHLGWRRFDNGWTYLHNDGAIGATGALVGFDTEIFEQLKDYRLPDPTTDKDVRCDGIRQTLKLLDTLPRWVIVPIIGAVFRAIGGMIDTSVHVVGQTGSFKSELMSLGARFYGVAMTRTNLPASWENTHNGLVKMLHLAKDATLFIDEFKPVGSRAKIEEMHMKADKVFRAQGNGSGRVRMNNDKTRSLQQGFAPRGNIVSTGEVMPNGTSLQARIVAAGLNPGDIALDSPDGARSLALASAQQLAGTGVFAQCMAGFIRWYAEQYEQLRERTAREENGELLSIFGRGDHARTPENFAKIMGGIDLLLTYARANDVIDLSDAEYTLSNAADALKHNEKEQQEMRDNADEATRWINAVRAMLRSGAAFVSDLRTGGEPDALTQDSSDFTPLMWGWEQNNYNPDEPTWRSRGPRIGWLDDRFVYLIPDAAVTAISRYTQESGNGLHYSKEEVAKRLDTKGWLAQKDAGRMLFRKRIQDTNDRYLCISRVLLDSGEAAESGR